MLDVDIAAVFRWSALLRSSCVPSVPSFPLGGAAGHTLAAWTRSVDTALAALNADLDRLAAAVSACASNYDEVS